MNQQEIFEYIKKQYPATPERITQNGKQIKYDEIDKSYLIGRKGGVLVHYLEQLQKDLASRG